MQKILQKLHKIQTEVGHMDKDGKKNTFQNYAYLSETQVTTVMKKLFDLHGVIFVHSSKIVGNYEISPTSKGTKQFVTDIEVTYKFYDVESGEYLEGIVYGQGADSQDKGVYKAITGAIKYIFMKNFLIPTGDDPENDTDKTVKKTTEVMGGTVVDDKEKIIGKTDVEKRNELYALLIEINKGSKVQSELEKILRDLTTFKGKDGKTIKGVSSLKDLKGKRLDVNIDKAKKIVQENTPQEA